MAPLPPSAFLQRGYITVSVLILALAALPALRSRLFAYGPRSAKGLDRQNGDAPATDTTEHGTSTFASSRDPRSGDSLLLALLEKGTAALQVPHHFFRHFYIVLVLALLFWVVQYIADGSLIRSLAFREHLSISSQPMSVEQLLLTWLLMFAQGVRRLYETQVCLRSSSTSTMFFVHWLLGMAFYLAMSVAVWIEGGVWLLHGRPDVSDLTHFSPPSLRTWIALPLFLFASGIQHDAHVYLASLPKYTLPMHPSFQLLLCPHYTAECIIYLALAIVAAPPESWFNRTLLAALAFVCVNLSVTAMGTRQWYEAKFGRDRIRGRWVMVPGLW